MSASDPSSAKRGWRGRLQPLRPESESMLHLDALRLIASAGIVIFHLGLPTWDWPALARVWAWRRDYNLFVDLFFVISGYVICAVYAHRVTTPGQYGSFLQRRAARLLPLHFATLAVFVCIGLAGKAGAFMLADPNRYNWSCLPANLLLVQSFGGCKTLAFNFVSWSISAELWIYAAFPLLLIPLRAGRAWLALTTAAVLGALIAAPHLGAPALGINDAFFEWTGHGGVLRGLGGFLVGMTFFQQRAWLARLPAPAPLMWLLLGLFLIAAAWHPPKLYLLAMVYGIAALAIAADQRGAASAVVRRLAPGGQLTYSLYMLHPLVFAIGIGLLGIDLMHMSSAAMRWMIVACVAILPVLAYLSLMLFERPARRWVAGLGRGRQAPAAEPAPAPAPPLPAPAEAEPDLVAVGP